MADDEDDEVFDMALLKLGDGSSPTQVVPQLCSHSTDACRAGADGRFDVEQTWDCLHAVYIPTLCD